MKKLKEMAESGKLMSSSLLWKSGMKEWVRADTIDELKDCFMPPVPPNK